MHFTQSGTTNNTKVVFNPKLAQQNPSSKIALSIV